MKDLRLKRARRRRRWYALCREVASSSFYLSSSFRWQSTPVPPRLRIHSRLGGKSDVHLCIRMYIYIYIKVFVESSRISNAANQPPFRTQNVQLNSVSVCPTASSPALNSPPRAPFVISNPLEIHERIRHRSNRVAIETTTEGRFSIAVSNLRDRMSIRAWPAQLSRGWSTTRFNFSFVCLV